MIFHRDRGSQYLSGERTGIYATDHGIRQSAGRVATCFDNSVAEAFWSSLKRELVHRFRFATRAQAKAAIEAWIRRYNNVRLHSHAGLRSADRVGAQLPSHRAPKPHNQVSGQRGEAQVIPTGSSMLGSVNLDTAPAVVILPDRIVTRVREPQRPVGPGCYLSGIVDTRVGEIGYQSSGSDPPDGVVASVSEPQGAVGSGGNP